MASLGGDILQPHDGQFSTSLAPFDIEHFMLGTWVTSFASLVHDFPRDVEDELDRVTPRIETYNYKNEFETQQADGYSPAATLLCLRFAPNGVLRGKTLINRGGRNIKESAGFNGTYTTVWNDEFRVLEGEFSTIFARSNDAADHIFLNYAYMAKSPNELEWVWVTSIKGDELFRSSVTRGTLTRVPDRLTAPQID